MVANSNTEVVSITCEMRAVGLMGSVGVFTESVRHVDSSVTNEPRKEDPPKKTPQETENTGFSAVTSVIHRWTSNILAYQEKMRRK